MFQIRRQTWFNLLLRAQGQIVQTKYTKDGRKIIPKLSNEFVEVDEHGRAMMEWSVLATVVDRVFFLLYVICFALSFCLIFPR